MIKCIKITFVDISSYTILYTWSCIEVRASKFDYCFCNVVLYCMYTTFSNVVLYAHTTFSKIWENTCWAWCSETPCGSSSAICISPAREAERSGMGKIVSAQTVRVEHLWLQQRWSEKTFSGVINFRKVIPYIKLLLGWSNEGPTW
jgi:hypothetical protein